MPRLQGADLGGTATLLSARSCQNSVVPVPSVRRSARSRTSGAPPIASRPPPLVTTLRAAVIVRKRAGPGWTRCAPAWLGVRVGLWDGAGGSPGGPRMLFIASLAMLSAVRALVALGDSTRCSGEPADASALRARHREGFDGQVGPRPCQECSPCLRTCAPVPARACTHAHPVLSRPRMHASRYLPLAASRPCVRACVRADAYLEADGVGEAGLFAFRFKCPYCPTEQMTSQCRELHF